jgi:ribose 5-phosphate isomerase A
MSADEQKKKAARAAADMVRAGMVVGLGTGSTATHLVKILGDEVRNGLAIRAIATSEETGKLAIAEGIELIEPDEQTIIDIAIDGTDEVDGHLNLIKGGGGALLREKIIAGSALKMVVIADASKKVAQLGAFPLPVEVDRFCWPLTVSRIREVCDEQKLKNIDIALRQQEGGSVFRSDGGNYIADLCCGRIGDAAALHKELIDIPGVIETGLFIDIADQVILASSDGLEILGE